MRRLFLASAVSSMALVGLAATGCVNIKAPERIVINGVSDGKDDPDDNKPDKPEQDDHDNEEDDD